MRSAPPRSRRPRPPTAQISPKIATHSLQIASSPVQPPEPPCKRRHYSVSPGPRAAKPLGVARGAAWRGAGARYARHAVRCNAVVSAGNRARQRVRRFPPKARRPERTSGLHAQPVRHRRSPVSRGRHRSSTSASTTEHPDRPNRHRSDGSVGRPGPVVSVAPIACRTECPVSRRRGGCPSTASEYPGALRPVSPARWRYERRGRCSTRSARGRRAPSGHHRRRASSSSSMR